MIQHIPGRGAVTEHIVVTVPVELKSLADSFQDLVDAAVSAKHSGCGDNAVDYGAIEVTIAERMVARRTLGSGESPARTTRWRVRQSQSELCTAKRVFEMRGGRRDQVANGSDRSRVVAPDGPGHAARVSLNPGLFTDLTIALKYTAAFFNTMTVLDGDGRGGAMIIPGAVPEARQHYHPCRPC